MPKGPTLLVDTSFLGDVLCAEPLVRAAARCWQGRPLDFLTSPGGADVLQGHPGIREILVFDKRGADRGMGGLRRMARRLRARGYARAVCSHRSWRTAFLLRLAGIPERIGFANASGARLYTRRVPYLENGHEIERNLRLVGHTGKVRPRMFPTAEERERAAHLAPPQPFVALAPGSIWATKRWPAERYAEVLRTLAREGLPCVLLGGEEDQELTGEILATAALEPGSGARILDLCGSLNLRESYALLEMAAVLVTNDSLPMHLGVAARIPVVAIYCSTVPEFGFAPRGPDDVVLEVKGLDCRPCGIHGRPSCPKRHFRCALDLEAAQVIAAVRKRLPVADLKA